MPRGRILRRAFVGREITSGYDEQDTLDRT